MVRKVLKQMFKCADFTVENWYTFCDTVLHCLKNMLYSVATKLQHFAKNALKF